MTSIRRGVSAAQRCAIQDFTAAARTGTINRVTVILPRHGGGVTAQTPPGGWWVTIRPVRPRQGARRALSSPPHPGRRSADLQTGCAYPSGIWLMALRRSAPGKG
jgi:hypothetical protein